MTQDKRLVATLRVTTERTGERMGVWSWRAEWSQRVIERTIARILGGRTAAADEDDDVTRRNEHEGSRQEEAGESTKDE